jgi:hypothetical protein
MKSGDDSEDVGDVASLGFGPASRWEFEAEEQTCLPVEDEPLDNLLPALSLGPLQVPHPEVQQDWCDRGCVDGQGRTEVPY